MSEPTEREWLEGLRPEDEREFYDMTSLRTRLVDAGARAIWDKWEALDDYEALDADGKANALADIEIVLDAMLDVLAENADEWADYPARGADPIVVAHREIIARTLIAALREDRSP